MIRTRDFVLFIAILLFLGVGIATTVFNGRSDADVPNSLTLTEGASTAGGLQEDTLLDRSSTIARLREKIKNSDTVIAVSPSVTADTAAVEQSEDFTDAAAPGGLQRCIAGDDSLALVPSWPLNKTEFLVEGTTRSVITTKQVVVRTNVSTTSPAAEMIETVTTALLTMPLLPVKLAVAACVPSEVIGVSERGMLLFNRDMRAYSSVPENVRIGYARDGFPIYGVYSGEVDQCGGYEHPTGYRYTVSPEREYVIGCYVAEPQALSAD